jgi:hypothetical protein
MAVWKKHFEHGDSLRGYRIDSVHLAFRGYEIGSATRVIDRSSVWLDIKLSLVIWRLVFNPPTFHWRHGSLRVTP